ncbi:MAG: omptin family outer membrane protease [Treponema sp.]|jgi:outer membrane protease|nr:omptin family outer membrane protease [Treponema sp.]
MKNITALSILVIIINIITVTNSAYCQEIKAKKYAFSIGPQFGLIYGQVLEFVYPVPGEIKSELMSELKWDMKSIFYTGVQVDFGRIDILSAPGFFSSLTFKAGIPSDSGIMEDRDWMSTENDRLTNFSSHTNRTLQFFSLDAAIGVSLPIGYFFAKPFVSGRWMRFSFTGRDGYGTYAKKKSNSGTFHPIDDNPDEITFSGDVIKYKQDWLLFSPGISVGAKMLPFAFDISFRISLFSYCSSKDDHLERKITFLDYTRNGLFIEPAFSLSFTVRRIELLLEFSGLYIGSTRGETYINDGNGFYLSGDSTAGAGISLLDTRFLVRIHL